MRAALAACALLATALTAPAARAEPQSPVLIVTEASDEAFGRRLEAELETLGIRAWIERPAADDTRPTAATLARQARERRAMAALRLVPSEGRVQLWLTDRVTGKTTLREVSVPRGDDANEVLALRAVELLRASLLELRLVLPPPGEVPPPAAAVRLAEQTPLRPVRDEAPGRLPTLWLGPAVAWSPGGTKAAVHPLVGLRWLVDGRLGPEVLALLPLSPTHLDGREGRAAVSHLLVSAGFRMEVPLGEVISLSFGGGVGLASQSADATANPGYEGGHSVTRSVAFHGALGLTAALSSRMHVGIETLTAVTPSRHVLTFAGSEVATWGRPIVVGSLVIGLRF